MHRLLLAVAVELVDAHGLYPQRVDHAREVGGRVCVEHEDANVV